MTICIELTDAIIPDILKLGRQCMGFPRPRTEDYLRSDCISFFFDIFLSDDVALVCKVISNAHKIKRRSCKLHRCRLVGQSGKYRRSRIHLVPFISIGYSILGGRIENSSKPTSSSADSASNCILHHIDCVVQR